MNRKMTSYVLVLFVVASLACQTLSFGGGGTGSSTDALFTDPSDPVNVTVELETRTGANSHDLAAGRTDHRSGYRRKPIHPGYSSRRIGGGHGDHDDTCWLDDRAFR